MPYHVMIWPRSSEQRSLRELYAFNLSEDELRERIIRPYEDGGPITWSGRTLPPGDVAYMTITETDSALAPDRFNEYDAVMSGRDVTNAWITGPPGQRQEDDPAASSAERDARRVMVVHGRNIEARDAMFAFLRSLSLTPIEWEQAIAETGMGAPHNLDAVRAAMDVCQAVVIVLTAEDQAGLLPSLGSSSDEDTTLKGQPRQNVILEAGLAMGVDRTRTILVELGPIRRASDFEGLNAVRLTNSPGTRAALRTRLRTAGCDLDDSGADWTTAAPGGDFEGCLVPWQPTQPAA